MAEPKWTPGPWKADIRVGCVAVYPADRHHECLAGASEWAIHYKNGHEITDENGRFVRWEVPDEIVANAHLIAAAPDLYEACEAALEHLLYLRRMVRGPRVSDKTIELLEAALRKARGEDT